jgi:serine/threonine protein phosphatase PrpC
VRIGQVAGRSDTGRKRRRNEDSFVIEPPLFAVADGMGGAQAGEIASRLAAEVLRDGPRDGGGDRVAALIEAANRAVYDRSHEDPSASGMGTTMTAALLEGGLVWIGHVGDSRAYLLRDGSLEQLTEDHSLVAELIRSGRLTPEEAEGHPQRSVITRALGTDPDVDVDAFSLEPREGDVFVLCSDGLTSMVDDALIRRTVEQHRRDLDEAARRLVAAANKHGGEDNITVVVFEIAGEEAPPAPDEDTGELPALGDRPADGDTLVGVEREPAVQTMVVPPAAAAALVQPARRSPAQQRDATARRVLAIVAVLLAVLALAALTVWGLRS